jgi:putative ABC transport system permease protein
MRGGEARSRCSRFGFARESISSERPSWSGRRCFRPVDAREDVRLAVRNLLRAPVFTLIAGTTIALGIGANTAVFSVVRAVLLQPLPVEAPDELVRISSRNDPAGVPRSFVSPTNFLEMRREARTFTDIAAWVDSESTILLGEEATPTRATLLAATWSLPDVLGVEPVLGRSFVASDEDPNAPGGVLLPYGTWQRIYGGDPDVLSRPLRFLGGDAPILGVLPPGLEWVLPPADVIVLLSGLEQNPARDDRWLSVMGRLAPGVERVAGEAEMATLAGAFAASNPQANEGWTYRIDPLDEVVLGEARPALLILLAAAGLVLLIACANVANLLLGRAEGRERDIALRVALGAARQRIARLLITESLILASVGAVAGACAGRARPRRAAMPASAPRPRSDAGACGCLAPPTRYERLAGRPRPSRSRRRRPTLDRTQQGRAAAGHGPRVCQRIGCAGWRCCRAGLR